MGYTHSFTVQPGSSAYASAWPAILTDTALIIKAIRARGIGISGPGGTGRPVLDAVHGISINGVAAAGLSYEPLRVPAPGPVAPGTPDDCRMWRFTKTEHRPYDLAVTSTLLRCHLLAPDVFRIGSNGDWIADWTEPEDANPRDLVRELFGIYVDDDPLVDTTEGLAVGPAGLTDPRLVENPVIL